MSKHEGSWWGWVVVGAMFMFFVLPRLDVSPVPFVIMVFVVLNVLRAKGRRVGRRPGPAVGPAGPVPGQDGAPRPPARTPQDPPRTMPTIDVPRYPGQEPVPPPLPGAPAPGTGTEPPSTDPVVSLGRLHLARCGRDLRTAVEQGERADVDRVLDEVAELSTRMQAMLEAGGGTPGSGRKEFRAGLRAVDGLVADARGEDPPGARVTRLTQACLRMGQTGRHE